MGASSLGIFAGLTFTGIWSTLLLKETKDMSLEQLFYEDRGDFFYGRSISCTWFAVLTLQQVSSMSSCRMA